MIGMVGCWARAFGLPRAATAAMAVASSSFFMNGLQVSAVDSVAP